MSITKKISLKFGKKSWYAVSGFLILIIAGYFITQIWLGPQVAGFLVAREDLIRGVKVRGRIEAPARIEYGSKISGTVVSVAVVEGQSIRAGQTLLVFENKEARSAYDKAKVAVRLADARLKQVMARTQSGSDQSLQRAQNTLDSARKQYNRTRELSAKGFVSQDQLGDSLRNLAIAQNKLATAQFQARANRAKGSDYMLAETALNKARANERIAKENLNNTVVKALSDGVLISRQVNEGSVVGPDKVLLILAPSVKTQLIAQLDIKYLQNINVGQQALIVTDEHPEQPVNAKVSYINSETVSMQSKADIKLDIDSPPDYLRKDMVASAEIEIMRRPNTLALATAAIREIGGNEPWVMLIENGRTQRRRVKLGMQHEAKVEILEGLREGDFVLPATVTEVEEGKRMRLANY
jgi:HlyD family secretion protein